MNFRRLVSAVAALAVAGTMCAGLAVTASADDVTYTYDILYGTAVTDESGATTGVTVDSTFTDDANVTSTTWSDANNNSALSATSGYALVAPDKDGTAWSKTFDEAKTTGTVHFEGLYYGTTNTSGKFQLIDSSGNAIFKTRLNGSGSNETTTAAYFATSKDDDGNYVYTEISAYARNPRTAGYYFSVDVDLDAKTIAYTLYVGNANGGYLTYSNTLSAACLTDVAGMYAAKSTYAAYITNVSLYSKVSSETKYAYTINYTLDNSTVKTTTGNVTADTVITAESVFTENSQKYYITASEAPTLTVTASGSNTLTVPVRKANEYSVKVSASYDSSVVFGDETIVEEEAVTIGYPKYAIVGDTLYTATMNYLTDDHYYSYVNSSVTEDVELTAEYTAESNTDAYVFIEAEDVLDEFEANSDLPETTIAKRASGAGLGNVGVSTLDTAKTITTLPAGTYTIEANYLSSTSYTYTITAGDTTVIDAAGTGITTSDEFTLDDDADVTIYASSVGSKGALDYILVRKIEEEPTMTATTVTDTTVGEISVPATIYDVDGNEVTSSTIEGADSVTTVYIKIENATDIPDAPTVTLNDSMGTATATAKDNWYTLVNGSYYFIYQFANIDASYITGATVTCGDLDAVQITSE